MEAGVNISVILLCLFRVCDCVIPGDTTKVTDWRGGGYNRLKGASMLIFCPLAALVEGISLVQTQYWCPRDVGRRFLVVYAT